MTRSQQLADAMLLIAKSDHYMVGLVEPVTADEIDAAEQILITRQYDTPATSKTLHRQLDLALDLIEAMQRKILFDASHGSATS